MDDIKEKNDATERNGRQSDTKLETIAIRAADSCDEMKARSTDVERSKLGTPINESTQEDTYKMDKNPSGLCVILNNKRFVYEDWHRQGSEKDVQSLTEVFESFNFIVSLHENLTITETQKLIEEIRHREELKEHDAFIFIMMSHGMEDTIYCSDAVAIYYHEIYEQFNNENCESLRLKPKIFIFQSCRGDHIQKIVKKSLESDGPEDIRSLRKLPTNSDILLCFSTVHGYESLRNVNQGSWYIQTLCDVLKNYAATHDICDILAIVDQRLSDKTLTQDVMDNGSGMEISNKSQTTNFKVIRFNKKLYLKR